MTKVGTPAVVVWLFKIPFETELIIPPAGFDAPAVGVADTAPLVVAVALINPDLAGVGVVEFPADFVVVAVAVREMLEERVAVEDGPAVADPPGVDDAAGVEEAPSLEPAEGVADGQQGIPSSHSGVT